MTLWFPVGAVAAGAAVAAHGMFERNSPVFGGVLRHLTAPDAVALTFDDGPHPEITPRVLDALNEAGVHATFFVLGRYAVRWPRLVARAHAEGHEIANHGFAHRKLHLRSPAFVRADIRAGTEAVADALGSRAPMRWFRAPHGFRSPWVAPIAREFGQRIVGWTLGVHDSADPGAEEIARRVARGVRGGGIVLLHDADGNHPDRDRRQTAESLPAILRAIRAHGLGFAPLDA